MSLFYLDGFSGYGGDKFGLRYPLGSNGLQRGAQLLATGGRFGTPALQYGGGRPVYGDNSGWMDIPNPVSRIILRLVFYISTWAGAGGHNNTLMAFYDLGGAHSGTLEFDDGYLQFVYIDNNGNPSTQCAQTSGATLNENSWNYVDLDLTASSSGAGAVTLYANGLQVATASSITTAHDNLVEAIGGFCSGGYLVLDHFCFFDPTSGPYTAPFTGSTRVLSGKPTANGRVNNFTPVGQPSNYACVDTAEPSDSQYVEDDNIGAEDGYALTFSPADVNLSTVLGLQLNAVARVDDTGSRSLALGIGNGTTESYGPAFNVPESYEFEYQGFETNPLTGNAFAAGDFATLQAFVKVAA